MLCELKFPIFRVFKHMYVCLVGVMTEAVAAFSAQQVAGLVQQHMTIRVGVWPPSGAGLYVVCTVFSAVGCSEKYEIVDQFLKENWLFT